MLIALQQKPRADQQHHRKSNLQRQQQLAHPRTPPPSAAAARRLLQRLKQRTAQQRSRRNQPRKHTATGHDAKAKCNRTNIQVHRVHPRHIRPRLNHPAHPSPRQRKSHRASCRRQHQALRHLLAQQPPPAASQCRANRSLFASRSRARHQQIGHIQAGNQQHAAGGTEQDVKLRLRVVHQPIQQRACVGRIPYGWIRRVGHMHALLCRIHLALRLRDRCARLEPCHHQEIVIVDLPHLLRTLFVVDCRPKLRRQIGIVEPRRQHANDGIGPRIEQNRLAQDCLVSRIAPHPKAVRQHHRSSRIRPVVRPHKRAAQHRLNTQQGEQIPRALRIANALRQRTAIPRETDAVRPIDGHLFYTRCLLFPCRVHPRRDPAIHALPARALLIKLDQPIRIFEWQRLEQHRSHHGKESRVRPNAKRHHHNRRNRKSRRPQQRTHRIPDVAEGAVKELQSIVLPFVLAYTPRTAKLDPGPPNRLSRRKTARPVLLRF